MLVVCGRRLTRTYPYDCIIGQVTEVRELTGNSRKLLLEAPRGLRCTKGRL